MNEAYAVGISFDPATDEDDYDSSLTYEYAWGPGESIEGAEWHEAFQFGTGGVPGRRYTVGARTKDPHGNYSEPAVYSFTFEVPRTSAPFGVSGMRWGYIDPEEPDAVKLTFDFLAYPFIPNAGEARWISDNPLSGMIFYLDRDPAKYFGIARGEYTGPLQVGEGSARLKVLYAQCSGGEGEVGALVMNEFEGCAGRGDSMYHPDITMPVGDEPGRITIDVTGLMETEKTFADLTAEDYITTGYLQASNGGRPRGSFGTIATDRNRYYFEPKSLE